MTYLLLPLTFQLVLQSAIVALFGLIFGKPVGFRQGILLLEWHEWFDKRWPFTTTVTCVMGASRHPVRPATWFHEMVHTVQYEEIAVISDIIALTVYLATGNWILALCIWGTAGPLWLLPGFLTAARYRKAWKELRWKTWRGLYRFSWFERDAYAQTEVFVRNGGGR